MNRPTIELSAVTMSPLAEAVSQSSRLKVPILAFPNYSNVFKKEAGAPFVNSSKITLIEKSVVNFLLTTASDGKSYRTKLYNLDAVITVGYRVNSKRATSFRIWTTQILREYIGKVCVMDDGRLIVQYPRFP